MGFGLNIGFIREAVGYYVNNEKTIDNWRLESEWRVPANLDPTSPWAGYLDNPYDSYRRLDSRGNVSFSTNLILNVGKKINDQILINSFFSFNKYGPITYFSLGFIL